MRWSSSMSSAGIVLTLLCEKMGLGEEEKAMALALVRAHVLECTDYCSMVHAYRRRLRKQDGRRRLPQYKWVVSHSRRRALYSQLIRNLTMTTKMPDIGVDCTETECPLTTRGFSQ